MSDLKPCPFCGEVPFVMSAGMAGQPRWQHPVNDTCPIAGHYLGGWDFPEQWNRDLPAVQPDDDKLVRHMTKLIAAGLDRIEQLNQEVEDLKKLVFAAYCEGFQDGKSGGWIVGPSNQPWKASDTHKALIRMESRDV